MTQSNRVVINTIATYGRSVIAIALGLFSTRWVVQGMGEQDFGLYSLVGATIAFMTLFNSILNESVARYYAYEIGADAKDAARCPGVATMKWFNTALVLHASLAIIIIVVGYPIGFFALNNWLVIPADRLSACVFVFNFAIALSVVSIVSAPYNAMFYATQNIVETSLWGIASIVCTCMSAYLALSYSGDRMKLYSLLYVGSQIIVLLCIVLRARFRFSSCRIHLSEFFNRDRIKSLLGFAGWQSYAVIGEMIRAQGNAIVINRCWGVGINASYAISNQVSGQAGALSQALQNAISPAIISKAGEGSMDSMSNYVESSNKISSLLIAVVAIPLTLEIKYVLRLWLGIVPEYTSVLCVCTLFMIFIDRLASGSVMAIIANGKVGAYQCCSGSIAILSVFFVLSGFYFGFSPAVIGVSFVILSILKTFFRLFFLKRLMGFSVCVWLHKVLFPVCFVCIVVLGLCAGIKMLMSESFVRVVTLSLFSLIVFLALSWLVILNDAEKRAVRLLYKSLMVRKRSL